MCIVLYFAEEYKELSAVLDDMKAANEAHQSAIMAILSNPDKYEGIEIPQLFQEMYMNDI